MTSINSLKKMKLLAFAALILLALRRQALLFNASLSQMALESDSSDLTFDPPVAISHEVDKPAVRKWAYVFVVGGCGGISPNYKGFLYNIAVAAQILKESGSKADIVALIQMSVYSKETVLPEEEAALLEAMDVKVQYIPKFSHPVHENFYSLMIEKFRILQMTQYSRVIFMDGDVMPFCSLDYLFELSEPEAGEPKFKENIVVSYSNQPAHGGFFMLHPGKGDYEQIQRIILETEKKALNLTFPEYWDEIEGWGHVITPPDRWRSSLAKYTSTNWSWHGVHADQGLLYHWTKYVKQSVTLIINREVEHWSSKNGTATMESSFYNKGELDLLNKMSCTGKTNAPYTDFQHFTGRGKPWEKNWTHYRARRVTTSKELQAENLKAIANKGGKTIDQRHLVSLKSKEVKNISPIEEQMTNKISWKEDAYIKWFKALDKVERKAGLQIHHEAYLGGRRDIGPPVGTYPKYRHRYLHIWRKSKNNWTAYESSN